MPKTKPHLSAASSMPKGKPRLCAAIPKSKSRPSVSPGAKPRLARSKSKAKLNRSVSKPRVPRIRIPMPKTISVPLVRADYLSTSLKFRTAFEIYLSLTGLLLGPVFFVQSVTRLHWVFLSVACLSSILFWSLSVWSGRRARWGN